MLTDKQRNTLNGEKLQKQLPVAKNVKKRSAKIKNKKNAEKTTNKAKVSEKNKIKGYNYRIFRKIK